MTASTQRSTIICPLKWQEARLPQRDRATPYVSRYLVKLTAAQLHEKIAFQNAAIVHDLEGKSKSSELPPFDGPYTTSHW